MTDLPTIHEDKTLVQVNEETKKRVTRRTTLILKATEAFNIKDYIKAFMYFSVANVVNCFVTLIKPVEGYDKLVSLLQLDPKQRKTQKVLSDCFYSSLKGQRYYACVAFACLYNRDLAVTIANKYLSDEELVDDIKLFDN